MIFPQKLNQFLDQTIVVQFQEDKLYSFSLHFCNSDSVIFSGSDMLQWLSIKEKDILSVSGKIYKF